MKALETFVANLPSSFFASPQVMLAASGPEKATGGGPRMQAWSPNNTH